MTTRKPPRILEIISTEPYQVTCLFTDGQIRLVNLKPLLDSWKQDTRTAPLLNFDVFKQVSVSEHGTLHWTNVLVHLPFLPPDLQYQPYDLDPDVLYEGSLYLDSISNVLKQKRRRAGLTQAELAKKSGMSRQSISRLENGKLPVRLDTLRLIENALK